MYDTLGLELPPRTAAILFGLMLGALFGAFAEVSRFCFRRALLGDKTAAATWLTALATATLGTQAALSYGLITFAEHRFMATDLPWLAILIGGVMFGAGMVLTRGCASRLTVLTGSGNLRAALVLVVFAITAHATLKGILAPLRSSLGAVTVPLPTTALPALTTVVIVGLAAFAIWRSSTRPHDLILGALIGLLVPAAWVGTGFVLYDDFDPIAFEGLSFTSSAAETLFWGVAASSIPAGFGTGLIGGVILGAAALSLSSGRFEWQSFETPRQTGRYLAGAILMGIGGVLAGGCTIGAGLSGIPSLSLAALFALLSIGAGGLFTARLIRDDVPLFAATPATPQEQRAA